MKIIGLPAETLATLKEPEAKLRRVFTDKNDLPATWQWPGLWTLNLPVLTLLWHVLFGHTFHIWLSGYHLFATAGLAWTFVAAERWIFFFRLRPVIAEKILGDELSEQRTRMIRIGLLIIGGLILIAIFTARTREVAGMLIWSSLGGAYLLTLCLIPRQTGDFLPREMALAGYLAGTALLFVWANGAFPPIRLLLPGLLFLLLLFYYFCLISSLSKPLLPTLSHGPILEGAAGPAYRGVPVFLMFAATLFVIFDRDLGNQALFLTIGVSAAILLLLDFWRRFLSNAATRLLADVALLSPLIPLLVSQ